MKLTKLIRDEMVKDLRAGRIKEVIAVLENLEELNGKD